MTRKQPKVIVLGNQKSGTTAIAELLARHCAFSKTIDVPRKDRKSTYGLIRNELTFADFVLRHDNLFRRDLVKIPPLTFFAKQVSEEFPNSKLIFVVRDPRENIRSLLNRRGIKGDRANVPLLKRLWFRLQGRPFANNQLWGNGNYIEALAHRWNLAVDNLFAVEDARVVKFEDFIESKQESIESLANEFGFESAHDISDELDIQFQPAGARGASWVDFFGETNLKTINKICQQRMLKLGYTVA